MSVIDQLARIWILVPVVLLFGVGFGLTLNSGPARLTAGQNIRHWFGNLTSTVGLIAVCLLGLLILQSMVGYNMQARW